MSGRLELQRRLLSGSTHPAWGGAHDSPDGVTQGAAGPALAIGTTVR
jgi:hypothetical protein